MKYKNLKAYFIKFIKRDAYDSIKDILRNGEKENYLIHFREHP